MTLTRKGSVVKQRCDQCGLSVHECEPVPPTTWKARDEARMVGWTFVYTGGRYESWCPYCIKRQGDAA